MQCTCECIISAAQSYSTASTSYANNINELHQAHLQQILHNMRVAVLSPRQSTPCHMCHLRLNQKQFQVTLHSCNLEIHSRWLPTCTLLDISWPPFLPPPRVYFSVKNPNNYRFSHYAITSCWVASVVSYRKRTSSWHDHSPLIDIRIKCNITAN